MKHKRIYGPLIVAAAAVILSTAVPASAQEIEPLTKEDYGTELERWQGRQQAAAAELARLEREITNLRQAIGKTEGNIKSERKELFNLLSVLEGRPVIDPTASPELAEGGEAVEEDTTGGAAEEGLTAEGELAEVDTTESDVVDSLTAETGLTEGELAEGEAPESGITEGETTEDELAEGEVTEGVIAEGEDSQTESREGEVTQTELAEGETSDEPEIEMTSEEYTEALEELKEEVAVIDTMSEEKLLGEVERVEELAEKYDKLKQSEHSAEEQNEETLAEVDSVLSKHRSVIPAPGTETTDVAKTEGKGTREQAGETGESVAVASQEAGEEETGASREPGTDTAGGARRTESSEEGELVELPATGRTVRLLNRYKVARGDNLWNISRREEIYNDPFQWMKIYTGNRDRINNPDLIYSDQIFDIPRRPAPGEHWVIPGESLSGIARKTLDNPFDWTKIYQANRSIIKDPNRIFPHQILIIPKKKIVKEKPTASF